VFSLLSIPLLAAGALFLIYTIYQVLFLHTNISLPIAGSGLISSPPR